MSTGALARLGLGDGRGTSASSGSFASGEKPEPVRRARRSARGRCADWTWFTPTGHEQDVRRAGGCHSICEAIGVSARNRTGFLSSAAALRASRWPSRGSARGWAPRSL